VLRGEGNRRAARKVCARVRLRQLEQKKIWPDGLRPQKQKKRRYGAGKRGGWLAGKGDTHSAKKKSTPSSAKNEKGRTKNLKGIHRRSRRLIVAEGGCSGAKGRWVERGVTQLSSQGGRNGEANKKVFGAYKHLKIQGREGKCVGR